MVDQQVPVWSLPGTIVDPSTSLVYNFEDDYETMRKDKTTLRSVREYWGVPRSSESSLRANEAVAIGVNPENGLPMYVPGILQEEEEKEEKHNHQSRHAINIDTSRSPESENEERFRSQRDEDYVACGASNYWYSQWDDLVLSHNHQAMMHRDANTIRTREEISMDKLRDINSNIGDTRLANIHKTLESFGKLRRAPHQAMFHDKFIISCLPHIYGSEWEWNQIRVLKQHNIPKINHEVMVVTPRRFGKTYSIAMIVAALLLCVIGIRIVVVSTGGRASTSLSRTVKKFVELSKIHEGAKRICQNNAEELFVRPAHTSDEDESTSKKTKKADKVDETNVSRLYSFPGNSKGRMIIIIDDMDDDCVVGDDNDHFLLPLPGGCCGCGCSGVCCMHVVVDCCMTAVVRVMMTSLFFFWNHHLNCVEEEEEKEEYMDEGVQGSVF